PGYLDERAALFDAEVARALEAADTAALRALDPVLAGELQVSGRAPWEVLAGAAENTLFTGALLYEDAPYGVGYLVATWSGPGAARPGERGRRTPGTGGRPGAVVLPAVRRTTAQEAGGGPAGGVLPPPAPEPGSSLCASRSTASLALPVPVWILSLYLPLVRWSTVFAALSRPLWILSPCCWARSETLPFAGPSLAFRLSRRPMVHLPSRPVLCAGALTGVAAGRLGGLLLRDP